MRRMPNLEALDLSYCCQVGDEEMLLLSNLAKLSLLVLLHCRNITGYGLGILCGSTSLRNVYLDGCSLVTEEVMKRAEISYPQINLIKFSL